MYKTAQSSTHCDRRRSFVERWQHTHLGGKCLGSEILSLQYLPYCLTYAYGSVFLLLFLFILMTSLSQQ